MADLQRGMINSLQQLLQYHEAGNWQTLFVVLSVLADLVSRMRTDSSRRTKNYPTKVSTPTQTAAVLC